MKVFVATYNTKHDDYVSVFATRERAEQWRQEIADEWWSEEFPDKDAPDDPVKKADEYFEGMMEYGEEFFSVAEHDVIG
jgi:hypothetical protein